jgi:hypothetical protein
MMTPCLACNEMHKGATLDHVHEDKEGVGYVRLLALGGAEFCWRCSCAKSSWVDVPNEVSAHCAHVECVCHTAERAH